MKRMVALCCVIAALGLVLSWELATPEDIAASNDAAVAADPSQATRTDANGSSSREFPAEALADIGTSITERPLFTPTRRASASPDKSIGPAAARQDVPRLTGVIVGPSGGWAIFADADGKSHAAAAGDAIGAFKVRAIGPGIVTLTGLGGDRVLRPTYVNPAAATASEIPTPDVATLPAIRANRNR
jgi:hypothetical protein